MNPIPGQVAMRSLRRVAAVAIRRPALLIWLAFPLMGVECVMSEQPLTPFEDGFIDNAAIGEWAIENEPGQELSLSVRVEDTGMMGVRYYARDVPRSYIDYRGYSSRLGDRTFINLQLIDTGCEYCSEAHLAEARAELAAARQNFIGPDATGTCSYLIVRYELLDDDRLVLYPMAVDSAATAIDSVELSGRYFPESAGRFLRGRPCVSVSTAELRSFVSENPETLFPGASRFVRRSIDD